MKTVKVSFILIVIIAISLFSIFQVENYISKQQNNQVQQVDISQLRQHITDSIRQHNDSIVTARIDSTRNYYHVQASFGELSYSRLLKENRKLSVKADTLQEYYNANHTITSCDSLQALRYMQIKKLEATIDTLEVNKDRYRLSDSLCTVKCNILSTSLENSRKDMQNANYNIDQLQRNIKKNNSWWKRNERWFYAVGGAVISGLVIR